MLFSLRELFNILKVHKFGNETDLCEYLEEENGIRIKNKGPFKAFFKHYKEKWVKANYMEERFLEKNDEWLNKCISFGGMEQPTTSYIVDEDLQSPQKVGRPSRAIEDCKEITRKRKLKEFNKDLATPNISEGLSPRYRQEHEKAKAQVVERMSLASPVRLKRILINIESPKNEPRKYTPDEALALFSELGLSKDKYIILRDSLKSKGHKALPGYNKIA